MKNLKKYKVKEMTSNEVVRIDGGCDTPSHGWWSLGLNIVLGPIGMLYDAGHYNASQ